MSCRSGVMGGAGSVTWIGTGSTRFSISLSSVSSPKRVPHSPQIR